MTDAESSWLAAAAADAEQGPGKLAAAGADWEPAGPTAADSMDEVWTDIPLQESLLRTNYFALSYHVSSLRQE